MRYRCLKRICVVVIVFLWTAAWLPAAAQENTPPEDKAAVVNDVVISAKLFETELSRIRQKLADRGRELSDSELASIKKELLDGMINRELILQEAHRQNITVKDSEVEAQFEALRRRYPTEADFKKAMVEKDTSEAEIKNQIRQEMEFKAFIDRNYAEKTTVPEQEARAYYDGHPDFFKQPETIRASHILIKVAPQADAAQKAEARRQLEQIQQKLAAGEDFGRLARQYSQGPSSSKDGDLGFFRRGQMVKPFEDAAFALKPGEVSGIVETDFGFHLIKVFEKKPEAIVTFDQVRGRIEQHLKQEKIRKEVGELLERLKQNAVIQKYR